MKNYMVHFRRNTYLQVSAEAIKSEQMRVAELMTANIMQQIFLSKAMDHLWMTFRTENEDELRKIIKTLPMSKDLYFEVNEIMG